LDFSSARNPGGGFLKGAGAQEESLARSSGLYPCLLECIEMYEHNRRYKSCLYSHHMIYSPNVPVIKDDNGELLEDFYAVSFISAPAVNAGVVKKREQDWEEKVEEAMKERLRRILSVAVHHGHDTLVLGAFGCGVFQNDPRHVASWFKELLSGSFNGAFARVAFAILEKKGERKLAPFQECFG